MTRHGKNCTAGAVYSYHERRKDTGGPRLWAILGGFLGGFADFGELTRVSRCSPQPPRGTARSGCGWAVTPSRISIAAASPCSPAETRW